jgi:hypothetical protein
MRTLLYGILLGLLSPLLFHCSKPSTPSVEAKFTRADSLTERYLSLHDSVHRFWNEMINDDNQKIKALHHLLHEIAVSHSGEEKALTAMEERLQQLLRMRYTQKTLSNPDIVYEYDIASQAAVSELLGTTRAMREYSYNKTLQKLVRDVESAELRTAAYRQNYDSLVGIFNLFIEENRSYLEQADQSMSYEKKPMFQVTSTD